MAKESESLKGKIDYSTFMDGVVSKTVDEHLEHIRSEKIGTLWPFNRKALLHGLGIRTLKSNAENLVIFGCSMPCTQPLELVSFTRTLDFLGVDWTYPKEAERCCGFALKGRANPSEEGRVTEFTLQLAQERLDMAAKHGAKNIIFYCQWCAHMAQWAVSNGISTHGVNMYYHMDFLSEALEGKELSMPPAKVGYWQGCHRRNRETLGNEPKLNWLKYNNLAARIKGLELVPLKPGHCCREDSALIVEDALEKKVDYIVTSCVECMSSLERATRRAQPEKSTQGVMPVKMLSEVICEAVLGPENYWRTDYGY